MNKMIEHKNKMPETNEQKGRRKVQNAGKDEQNDRTNETQCLNKCTK